MNLSKLYRTEAIVLRRKGLGEADSLLTLYTSRLGKVRAVARGAQRPRSKLGGHLEPLTYCEMQLAQSRNLDIVTQCETIEGFLPLRNDLWRSSCAVYTVELVDRFTAEKQENYAIFNLLLDTLRRLCQVSNSDALLRCFELHLLDCLGYRPQLQQCVNCNLALSPRLKFFSASAGGVLCVSCHGQELHAQPLSGNALKALRFLQRHDYPVACRLRMSPQLAQEVEQLLQKYIRYLAEQEIKSAAWLNRLRSSTDRG